MFNLGSVLASSWASFNEPNPTNNEPNSNSPNSNSNDYANPNLKHAIGCPGEQAVVDEVIIAPAKAGRVYFRDSWWPAQCVQEITMHPGDIVRVVGIEGITLIVEPFADCSSAEAVIESVIETVIEAVVEAPANMEAY